MADRASASIVIGGAIHRSHIPGLIEAISSDGGRADWEGEPLELSSVREGETLEACAYEQPGGTFDWTEQFCEAHNIPYVRNSGSCGGVFGPERVVFTGAVAAVQFDMTENDEIVLARSMIRELGTMAAVEAWFAQAEFAVPPFTIVEDGIEDGEATVGVGEAVHG